jgi:hypothetical protein
MNVIKLPQTDVIATAPGCFDLPMAQAVIIEGDSMKVCLVTCWELTDEELTEVIKTKRLYLRLMTAQTPPVSLEVVNPFTAYNNVITLKQAQQQTETNLN